MISAVSDQDLSRRATSGDYEAFEELVRRYESSVYHLALKITRSPEEAEEVLQETFLSVFENLKDFRGDSSFKTWLYRIATNFALMKLRKSQKIDSLNEPLNVNGDEIPKDVEDWSENPEGKYEQEELKEILKSAMDSLPEIYRTVFLLRDVEGMSNQEVADILGLSLPAVKSRALRARLQLREVLAPYFKEVKEHGKM